MLLKRARELAELQSQHGQTLRSVEDLAQLMAMWKPGVYTKEGEEVYVDSRYAARETAGLLASGHGSRARQDARTSSVRCYVDNPEKRPRRKDIF
jgi:hypothetical protein